MSLYICAEDMQNVMSMPNAARVNVQGLGELLALNMCYFVINLLFVMVSRYI